MTGADDDTPEGTHADDPAAAEVVARLQRLTDPPVPPAVRERHLRTISAAARPAGRSGDRPGRSRKVRSRSRRRLVRVAVATLTLAVLSSGVALAGDAAPDDPLYTVKRTTEQAWSMVPRGPERSAELQLALATRRLDEARRAPLHAERLVAEGVENAEAAADERPEEALDALARLLGDGEDRLPDHASPRARSALHRNCMRIADRHGLDAGRCGAAPPDVHPGGGQGRGQGQGQGKDHPQEGRRGHGGDDADGPRGHGWGPGGRPEGTVGPPPGVPSGRGWGPGGRPDGMVGPPPGVPSGRGWGPGGRPEDTVGPPPGVTPVPEDDVLD